MQGSRTLPLQPGFWPRSRLIKSLQWFPWFAVCMSCWLYQKICIEMCNTSGDHCGHCWDIGAHISSSSCFATVQTVDSWLAYLRHFLLVFFLNVRWMLRVTTTRWRRGQGQSATFRIHKWLSHSWKMDPQNSRCQDDPAHVWDWGSTISSPLYRHFFNYCTVNYTLYEMGWTVNLDWSRGHCCVEEMGRGADKEVESRPWMGAKRHFCERLSWYSTSMSSSSKSDLSIVWSTYVDWVVPTRRGCSLCGNCVRPRYIRFVQSWAIFLISASPTRVCLRGN